MRIVRWARWTVAVLTLPLVLAAGCSSSGRSAQPVATATSSSSIPPTTVKTQRPPTLMCLPHPPRSVAARQVPGTSGSLVPGQPTELLACRYHGLNQPQPVGTLASSARLSAGLFAAALNAAPPIRNPRNFMCPIDFDETIILLFGYADGARLTVSVATGGCEFASNGDRTVHIPTDTLVRLEAVLGHDQT